MRIAVDVAAATQQGAGVARYTTKLLESLLQVAPENEYVLFYNAHPGAMVPPAFGHLPQVRVGLSNKLWRAYLLLAQRLPLPGLDHRLPGVNVFHGTDCLLPPLDRVPAVVTVHDLSFLLFPQFHLPLNRMNLRLSLPGAVRQARRVIADSECTRRDLVQHLGVPEEKIRVVPPGVGSHFQPLDPEVARREVEAKFGLGRRYVLTVGTIEPRKNLVTLLRAFEKLRLAGRSEHALVFVGQRGWRSEGFFNALARSLVRGDVIMAGRVNDEELNRLYSAADLFVFPSNYEGFGLPVLEAMACGTPVLVSNRSSLPEVVGDAGVLFDSESVDGLAQAMERLLADRRGRGEMIRRGVERARQFTWRHTAEATLEVYAEAVEPRDR